MNIPTNSLFENHCCKIVYNIVVDGEPGGILSLGFLTQSTQAAKL